MTQDLRDSTDKVVHTKSDLWFSKRSRLVAAVY